MGPNYESGYYWMISTINLSILYVAVCYTYEVCRMLADVQVVAGAKSPRAGARDDSSSAEPFGEEVGPSSSQRVFGE